VSSHFLIVDDDGFVAGTPISREEAERRLRLMNALQFPGPDGEAVRYALVQVDAVTHEAAMRRYILRVDGWRCHVCDT
jgi:hypothetical protein